MQTELECVSLAFGTLDFFVPTWLDLAACCHKFSYLSRQIVPGGQPTKPWNWQ